MGLNSSAFTARRGRESRKLSLKSIMIDFLNLFQEHGIEVKRTIRDNVEIHCPWCGAEDRGKHLALQLSTGYFHCWRNQDHRGRNPSMLLQLITGLGRAQIDAMLSSTPLD